MFTSSYLIRLLDQQIQIQTDYIKLRTLNWASSKIRLDRK